MDVELLTNLMALQKARGNSGGGGGGGGGEDWPPTDGKTHIWIEIPDVANDEKARTFSLEYNQVASTPVVIDWGDGSEPESDTEGGSDRYLTHIYSTHGIYEITMVAPEGATYNFPSSTAMSIYGPVGSTYVDTLDGYFKRTRVIRTYFSSQVNRFLGYVLQKNYCLEKTNIPSAATSIENYMFDACYSLKEIDVPSTVKSIKNYAFRDCRSLKKIESTSPITSIGNNAFENCYLLREIDLGDTMTSIGSSAFMNCYSLEAISIPNLTTTASIQKSTFEGCAALRQVDLPSHIVSIGDRAFYTCRSLGKITLPASVNTIGSYSFNGCVGLSEVHLLSETPPGLSAVNAFQATTTVFYVPYSEDHSILEAYKTATNWSTYASRMVEEAPQ